MAVFSQQNTFRRIAFLYLTYNFCLNAQSTDYTKRSKYDYEVAANRQFGPTIACFVDEALLLV